MNSFFKKSGQQFSLNSELVVKFSQRVIIGSINTIPALFQLLVLRPRAFPFLGKYDCECIRQHEVFIEDSVFSSPTRYDSDTIQYMVI